MRRVDATFIARRNKVVTKRIAGKDEKRSGFSTYNDVKRTINEITMFNAIQTSSTAAGSGKIRIAKIPTIAAGTSRWLNLAGDIVAVVISYRAL
jgi:hypothetical protein